MAFHTNIINIKQDFSLLCLVILERTAMGLSYAVWKSVLKFIFFKIKSVLK